MYGHETWNYLDDNLDDRLPWIPIIVLLLTRTADGNPLRNYLLGL